MKAFHSKNLKTKIFAISASFIILLSTGCTSTSKTSSTAGTKSANPSSSDIKSSLTDPEATANAKLLYNYIRSVYGKQVITGQMENAWDDSFNQLQQVYDKTQKYPALMGFDFMNYSSLGWNARNLQIQRAINFWNGMDYEGNTISKNHGIVAFCWHWRDPMAAKGQTGEFYAKKTGFRIPYDTDTDTWKTESQEYKEMIADLDTIAAELLKLQFADVPVIWRPLHEAAGNVGLYLNVGTAWFWWGAGNSTSYNKLTGEYSVSNDEDVCAECFIALWKLMYEYFTKDKGLHNLIWCWNGQNRKFYPGSEYVDMIGDDIYANNKDYSGQAAAFSKFQLIDITKPLALSECGVIPSLEKMQSDGAMWSFFMVWNDSKKTENNENFWNGQAKNPDSHKTEVYQSELAITLDKLPDFTKR